LRVRGRNGACSRNSNDDAGSRADADVRISSDVQYRAGSPVLPAAKPAKPAAQSSGGYFIEFRAARIGIYGHSYVAYGRLDRFGNPDTTTYADRHPMGNYAIMALGHFVPVPANTEWDPEVLDLPIAHKYRVKLNDSQYNNLLAAVKRANANTSYWNAVTTTAITTSGNWPKPSACACRARFICRSGFIPDLQEMNEAAAPPMANPTRPAKPPKKKSAVAATLATETNALGH
jgi:hypothetical protein